MKLFYCEEKGGGFCWYLVVMAENIEECEEKIKAWHDPDEETDWDKEFREGVVKSILENKENWKEVEGGVFRGSWD